MNRDPWPDLKGVHVFVVDDNDDSRRLLEQALHYCGALATVFSSAEAALEAVNEYLPTLIISDISMPGMTGLDFIRRLRERPPEKDMSKVGPNVKATRGANVKTNGASIVEMRPRAFSTSATLSEKMSRSRNMAS